MGKKILLIGCGGYLGSSLIPYFSSKGFEIKGFDIGFFKKCNFFVNPIIDQKITYKDVEQLTKEEISNYDCIIHLAGISNDPLNKFSSEDIYNPTRNYTLKIAKIAKELKIKFIFASSCSVYGETDTNCLLDENSKTNPQTGYSLNKLQIEQDLAEIADENFFPICLRFATIFGVSPRIRFDVVINMLVGLAFTEKKIILNSDGKAWRPNLYIEDACTAIEHAINYEKSKDDDKILILNIGREDNNLTIIKIAEIIKKLIPDSIITFLNNKFENSKNNLIYDRKIKNGNDTRTYKVSFKKVKEKFPKFACKFTVEDGIKKMISDFNEKKLSSLQFKKIDFYRLQYLESLYRKNLIDEKLKWKI